MACSSFFDEEVDVLLDFAFLKSDSDFLARLYQLSSGDSSINQGQDRGKKRTNKEVTYSIITNTSCGSNIGVIPQTAPREIQSLLFEILELITSDFPFLNPLGTGLFERLYGVLVLVAVLRKLGLCFLQFSFIFALLLTHNHMALSEVSLDAETILFETVASLSVSVMKQDKT